jgi:putative ABC transport system ATP-binding protein
MTPRPLIELSGVTKVYTTGEVETVALRGIDLTIAEGDFVAIMGPSGSGKSTLMNIIGCLDTPTSGTYYLAGEDVSTLPSNRLAAIRNKRIGFVFQQFNLLPRTTALENVVMPLLYSGKSLDFARARALLERFGLGRDLGKMPNQLSGGQQQRVAIARALINDPDIILADEPTGSLDTQSGAEIMETLAALNAEGKTVILITHEEYIARYSERIVRIRDGRILSIDPVTPDLRINGGSIDA